MLACSASSPSSEVQGLFRWHGRPLDHGLISKSSILMWYWMSLKLTISVQASITKYHSLSDINIKHLFLTVLKSGSLRSRYQYVRILVNGPLSGLQMAVFFLCPYTVCVWVWGGRISSLHVSSYKVTNPIH